MGWIIRGASPAHSWRIVELIPIESPIHPNAWRARMEPLGPWEPDRPEARFVGVDCTVTRTGERPTLYYATARERELNLN